MLEIPCGDEVIRGMYRSLELRDMSRVGLALAEDVRWLNPKATLAPDFVIACPDRLEGRNHVLLFLTGLIEQTGGSYSVRLQSLFVHSNDRSIAFHEVTTGEKWCATGCVLYELGGGVIQRVVAMSPARSTSVVGESRVR
ncbi:hypothetical protein CLV47_107175 [Antricoccus suffuscus]|uniref:SnoaL-like protein n=1 Tax=Antricoccus suffuscus TaxID=1629062 RepID=A0A2T1A0N1_9ACTN|nr:nuclear transport factor 2 family protein [Antricoccus suffuscus]PRZ42047.1 hypothetical protein CLV47_107175 [Antricoccus suffuscus]